MTAAQQRDAAARKAMSQARWTVLCRASDDGMDRAAAAARARLSPAGMTTLLYRRRGTSAWPLKEGNRP